MSQDVFTQGMIQTIANAKNDMEALGYVREVSWQYFFVYDSVYGSKIIDVSDIIIHKYFLA